MPEAVYTSAGNALMRSLKREPFLLMESTPSSVSWRSHNPLKRPGMHMLSSMQQLRTEQIRFSIFSGERAGAAMRNFTEQS